MRFVFCCLVFAATSAFGAKVIKVKKNYIFVSAEGQTWEAGQTVCVTRATGNAPCGEIVKVSPQGPALVRLPAVDPSVRVGDAVAPGERAPASVESTEATTLTGEPTADPARYSKVAISFELLGPAIFYSPFLSARLGRHFALNFNLIYNVESFGTVSSSKAELELPLSGSALFGSGNHFFETLFGFNLIFGFGEGTEETANPFGGSSRGPNSGIVGQLGLGYRYWPAQGGFHFRFLALANYGALGGGTGFLPWIGLAVGAALK